MARPAAIPSANPLSPTASHGVLLGERALPRVAISFPVRLHVDDAAVPHYARARDLSVAGVGIESPLCLALEKIRGVTLAIPTGRIDLAAEGCWQEAAPAEGGFLAGIRFVGVESIALNQLWDLVHRQTRNLMRCFSQVRELEPSSLDDSLDLIHLTRLREIPEGGVLYRQGIRSPGGDSIFIVTSGEATIDTWTAGGRRIVLGRAGPGEVLGGLALIANVPPDESATALRDTSLLELSCIAFDKLRQTNPALAFEIAASVMRSHLARRARLFDRWNDTDASAQTSRENGLPVHCEGAPQ